MALGGDAVGAEEARRVMLAAIARRARKVAEVASDPNMARSPEALAVVLAQFGFVLMIGLAEVCGDRLRSAWLHWLSQKTAAYFGCCEFCGRVKAKPDDPMCADCEAECSRLGQELALEVLADMPARSDKRTNVEPDPRD
jgi:hypothetical protein